MTSDELLADLAVRLPRHARLVGALVDAVRADDRYRWLELGCSLGNDGGDEHSDADVGIGYVDIDAADLGDCARSLADRVGTPIEALVHQIEGHPDSVCRVAAEYDDGVQLDCLLMPNEMRPGLSDRSVALVDDDGVLAERWVPESAEPPSAATAREWLVLGWWALSDVAKYVARSSWFEAVESIGVARRRGLQLWAAGAAIPYPSFGLTSLLDYPPFDVPAGLDRTYAHPADPESIAAAAQACGQLLDEATGAVSDRLGVPLDTPLADAVRARIASC